MRKKNSSLEINRSRVYGNGGSVKADSESKISIVACDIYENGYPVFITGGSSSFFQNCKLYDNNGRGIAVGDNSSINVSDCVIHDNKAGSIQVNENCQASISNCEIYKNGDSIDVVGRNSLTNIRNCKIHDCVENEINITDGCGVVIENCEISPSNSKYAVFYGAQFFSQKTMPFSMKHSIIVCSVENLLDDRNGTFEIEDVICGERHFSNRHEYDQTCEKN